MDIHAWIAIATLVVAMVLFISKLIPLEVTALLIPVVLAVTGTIDPAEAALRGFSNSDGMVGVEIWHRKMLHLQTFWKRNCVSREARR